MNEFPTSSELRREARASLSGNWGKALLVFLIFGVISYFVQFVPFVGPLALFLCSGAFTLGAAMFCLKLVRGGNPTVGTFFEGFEHFGRAFVLYLLMGIFTFLWTLLLIVPGIIAIYRYSQAYYILLDYPEIGALEAIKRSKEMMRGYKWKLFVTHLTFIGWYLLSILTLGIGFLWLVPYVATTVAQFYESLPKHHLSFGQKPPAPETLGIYPNGF